MQRSLFGENRLCARCPPFLFPDRVAFRVIPTRRHRLVGGNRLWAVSQIPGCPVLVTLRVIPTGRRRTRQNVRKGAKMCGNVRTNRWLGTSAGIRSCCVLCRKIGQYGRLLLRFSSTFSRWGSACPCFSFTTSYTNMLFQGPVGACVLYWEEDGRHSTAPCSRAT